MTMTSSCGGSAGDTTDSLLSHGRWQGHHRDRSIPHRASIPARIAIRVLSGPANYGVNTALLTWNRTQRLVCFARNAVAGNAGRLPAK